MINVQDLRIGNFIQYNGLPFWVRQITATQTVQCCSRLGGVWKHFDMEQLQGIPLTEEILVKCGFFIDESNGVKFISLGRTNRAMELYLVAVTYGNLILSIRYDLEFIDLGTRIQHLHQLQNLFYSLTGTELEVKL